MSQYYASRPQSIYAVSIDSRSRRVGDPINDYIVNLGDVVQRVKSVQVGSIELPDYSRDAVPRQSTMPISEPLDVPISGLFVVQENTRVLNRVTNNTVSETSITGSAYLPPTLNPVIAVVDNGSGLTITTQFPNGLAEISSSYPPQLSAVMVGTAFPWSNTSNARPPSLIDKIAGITGTIATNYTATSFQIPTAALQACAATTETATDLVKRFIDGQNYTSYVYVQRPCLAEVVEILNTQLAANQNLKTQPRVSLNDAENALQVRAVPSEESDRTFITGVTSELTATMNGFLNLSPSSLTTKTGIATPLTNIWQVRTPILPPGTYAPSDVQTVFSQTASPLKMDQLFAPEDPNTRSFYLFAPGGTTYTITIVAGRYTGEQLAKHLEGQIALTTSTTGVYTVKYLPRQGEISEASFFGNSAISGGKFQFTHNYGLQFGLAFVFVYMAGGTTPTINDMGNLLGFNTIPYQGSSTYTSTRAISDVPSGYVVQSLQAGQGNTTPVNISGSEQRWQREAYEFVPDNVSRKFNIGTLPNLAWQAITVSTLTGSAFSNGSTTISGWQMQYNAGVTPTLLSNSTFVITGANLVNLLSNINSSGTLTGSLTGSQFITTTGTIDITNAVTSTTGVSTSNMLISNGYLNVTSTGNLVGSIPTILTGTIFPATADNSNLYIPIVPQGYHGGEVLQVCAISGVTGGTATSVTSGDVFTVIVAKPWDGLTVSGTVLGITGLPYTTMFPTASIGYGIGAVTSALPVTGPTITCPFNVWANRRSSFQMHYSVPTAPARQLGFSRQSYPVLQSAGQIAASGAAFPPGFNNKGTGIYSLCPGGLEAPYNIPSTYTAPYTMDLLAPRYILMIIRAANPPSKRQTHVWKETSFPILAKFIFNDAQNYVRITEDMTNYVFTDFERLTTLRVSFVYGDGTPVDFNGHDHTFTLLFTTAQGESDALCL